MPVIETIWAYLEAYGRLKWYPCRDSNPGTRFRKPMLYPLSYRGASIKLKYVN